MKHRREVVQVKVHYRSKYGADAPAIGGDTEADAPTTDGDARSSVRGHIYCWKHVRNDAQSREGSDHANVFVFNLLLAPSPAVGLRACTRP